MRKINKIFSILAVASLAGFVSCQVEEVFKPGEEENEACEGVYFPKQKKIEESQVFDPTQDKVDTIKVCRSNAEGELVITPRVALTADKGKGAVAVDSVANFFTVSDIVFADGQTESYVALDFSDAEESVSYDLSISIDRGEYASIYSSSLVSCDYKVMCVAYTNFTAPKQKTPARVTFNLPSVKYNGVTGLKRVVSIRYYEVGGIRYCETFDEAPAEAPANPAEEKGGFWGTDSTQHLKFKWFVADQEVEGEDEPLSYKAPEGSVAPAGSQCIELQTSVFMHGEDYTMPADYFVYGDGYGYPSYLVYINKYPEELNYYDGNGGFYFWILAYFHKAGYDYVEDYDMIGIAEGFPRADYSIQLTAGMTQQDSKGDNVVPVDFKIGADVDKVGYTVLEGVASGAAIDKEVAAIAKDTINRSYCKYVDAEGVSFSDSIVAPSTGVFTLVAVTIDTLGKAKSSASVVFKYLKTGEGNEPVLSVVASGVEKYASRGYETSSSFVYTITGSGLTGVVPFIYPAAKIASWGGIDAVVDDMLANPNENYEILGDPEHAEYYLSDKALADVNDKGYTDIATGLNALTQYYIIVWATNGYDCTVKYDTYTTEGLPNAVVVDGKGAFAYDFFDEEDLIVADDALSLEYNPNTKGFEIPSWGAGTTFKFSVAADSSITVPLQAIGLSDPDEGPLYVIGNAGLEGITNADYVASVGGYFGFDMKSSGYLDEDGNFHFYVTYLTFVGGVWYVTEEIFYPAGFPAPASAPTSKHPGKVLKSSKPTANSVKIEGVEGLEPVVERVKVSHEIGSYAPKQKSPRHEIKPFKR